MIDADMSGHIVRWHRNESRKPFMVMKEGSGRWMTLRFNDKTGKNEPDAVFRLDALAEY